MITVCLSTHNGEKHIAQQLKNILCQLGDKDELIVSDRCSTDNTLSVIRELNDNRIKIFLNINGLNFATGNYIFLCEQDDVWLENRVKAMSENLKRNILVVSNFASIDSNGIIIEPRHYNSNPTELPLIKTMPFDSCSIAFRRELLYYALPFPHRVTTHENWLGILASEVDKIAYVDECLTIHPYTPHAKHGFTEKWQFRKALKKRLKSYFDVSRKTRYTAPISSTKARK